LKDKDGDVPTQLVAEHLNNYFTNVVLELKHNTAPPQVDANPALPDRMPVPTTLVNPSHSFFLSPVTPQEISKIIDSLKNKKTKSPDLITVEVLKKKHNSLSNAYI